MTYGTTIATTMISEISDEQLIKSITKFETVQDACKWANSPEWEWLPVLAWPPVQFQEAA